MQSPDRKFETGGRGDWWKSRTYPDSVAGVVVIDGRAEYIRIVRQG